MINCVIKRDGSKVLFNPDKIYEAVKRACAAQGINDHSIPKNVRDIILYTVEHRTDAPTVEEIQDLVESSLMNLGQTNVAKAYILYRQKRKERRESRNALLDGKHTNLKFSDNALIILRNRYLLKEDGKISETPEQLFKRVAKTAAAKENDPIHWQEKFYHVLSNLEFLPASPTIMNAGTKQGQLFPAYALPIPDKLEGIFETLKRATIIHKKGGGTGFSFSNIRPKKDNVKDQPIAPGPVAFMQIFNTALGVIKQNGKRQGGNMAILRVDHPDIIDFITLKENPINMSNFNISVAITEEFMHAVENDKEFELKHPTTKETLKKIPAKQIFDLIVLMAWKGGDPGIVFIDRMNQPQSNPCSFLGPIETTNPCGEQPLYPNEATPFGSINLARMTSQDKIDYDKLRDTVSIAVRLLDNLIDSNNYPYPETENLCKSNRRIGLGVMGFSDMLFQLGIPYDSEEGVDCARKIMQFIKKEADNSSIQLAETKGPFPNYLKTPRVTPPIRNASRTTISPTGSISMIADTSPGIEPAYAIAYVKRVLGGKELFYVNPAFEQTMRREELYTEELMKLITHQGSIQNIPEIPDKIKKVFKTAHEIQPQWHIAIQAAFQENCDNAVSKTVNFPFHATPNEVAEAYWLAYRLGCKGITIYRDSSRDTQVLSVT